MNIEYNNIDSLINGFNKILKVSTIGVVPKVPTILILTGVPRRPGLSASKIASRIIARKGEAGLSNTGILPSGEIDPSDIMLRITIEELVKALQQEAVIPIAVNAGIALSAAGTSTSGPVTVAGSTISPASGYGIIQ